MHGSLRNLGRLVLLLAGLGSMAGPAQADWAFLVAADDADWYIDEILTRKRGTMAKVWTLQDYRGARPLHSGVYFSSKTQLEIRCHSRQWRVYYFSAHSGKMGEGEQLYAQETPGAWKNVAPGSYSEAAYKAGCRPGRD